MSAPLAEPVRVGDWAFDRGAYDREADVYYLHAGRPRPAIGEETPEGHIIRFDEAGEICGLTLIDAARRFREEGCLEVTVARPERLEPVPPEVAG